jgi:hypothetical protein
MLRAGSLLHRDRATLRGRALVTAGAAMLSGWSAPVPVRTHADHTPWSGTIAYA